MDPTQDRANKGSRGRRNYRDGMGIYNAKSESRKEFTQVKIKDARERLKDIPIIAAKERRQKMITENREKRIEDTKEEQRHEKINNKQLVEMLKDLTKALKEFEEITRKEMENIMIIVDRRYKISEIEFERIEEECRAIKEKLKQTEKLATQIKPDNERRMNKHKETINWRDIKETYVHNQYRYRNGIAILKHGENKFTKVPLIPKYKFNYYTRKWRTEYMVQTMSKSIKYVDFYKENRDILVKGGKNIMKAMRTHRQIKENAMKEYRERLRNNMNPTTEEYQCNSFTKQPRSIKINK